MIALMAALLTAAASSQTLQPTVWPPPRVLQPDRLDALGIRIVRGEHVTLVTDLPESDELDRLPAIAAAALPSLADYFSLDPATLNDWRVHAYVVGDREKFAAAGLLPPEPNAEFPHGLSMGFELWLNEQESDYYRRALFLHELTHSFMSTNLGSCGPGWYMEGIAELMGGHALNDETGDVRLRVLPASRTLAPLWGRVSRVRKAKAPLTIDAVMKIDNRHALSLEAYAWVWAMAKFLDTHPRYRDHFRKLSQQVLQEDFDTRFRQAYAKDWRELTAEFQLFAATLEYGHDIQREAIEFQEGESLSAEARVVEVRADRGWQSSGLSVRQGETYAYKAKGMFTIAREPDGQPWPCDAGGVTITYQAGRPLGQLLAAIDSPGGFLRPISLGTAGAFTAPSGGTLYLRVNDSPAKLSDNEGALKVALKWTP